MLGFSLVLIGVGVATSFCARFCFQSSCVRIQYFVVFRIDRVYMLGNILKSGRAPVRLASYATPAQHSEGSKAWCRRAMLLSVVHVEVQVSDGLSATVLRG